MFPSNQGVCPTCGTCPTCGVRVNGWTLTYPNTIGPITIGGGGGGCGGVHVPFVQTPDLSVGTGGNGLPSVNAPSVTMTSPKVTLTTTVGVGGAGAQQRLADACEQEEIERFGEFER